jgi:hypothetical protein
MPRFVRAQLDYYSVLEITPAADTAEVNAAFRRLAWRYHPDRNPAPGATLQFQDINEAHQVLSDPVRRAEYDTKWQPWTDEHRQTRRPDPRPRNRRRWRLRSYERTVLLAVVSVMFVSSAWTVIYNTMKAAHAGGFSFAPEARVATLAQPASDCSYSMEIIPVISMDARGRRTVLWEAEMQNCYGGAARVAGRPQFTTTPQTRPLEASF